MVNDDALLADILRRMLLSVQDYVQLRTTPCDEGFPPGVVAAVQLDASTELSAEELAALLRVAPELAEGAF